MTIGDRIKRRRQELGLSVDEVAEKLKKNRATIYRYESHDIEKLPTTILEPLALVLKCTPGYLMGWESDAEDMRDIFSYEGIRPISTQKIPLLGDIACGEPVFNDHRNVYVEADSDIKADFCLQCKGDSMINARIYDGDIVFIQSTPIVENGCIAAVSIDNEATLKRVYYYPKQGKLILSPENPRYEPFVYVGEELNNVRILGKAVAFTSLIK